VIVLQDSFPAFSFDSKGASFFEKKLLIMGAVR
jgi:hypothetical protein